MPKKILFISHDATQSGAPLVLLDTIKWLKDHTTWKMDLLLLAGGTLRKDFSSTFNKVKGDSFLSFSALFLENRDNIMRQGFFRRNFKLILRRIALAKVFRDDYDLIYGNSAATAEAILEITQRKNIKTIIHIHELHDFVVLLEKDETLRKLIPMCDKIIAVSKKCNLDIIKYYGANKDAVELIYPCRKYTSKIGSGTNIRELHGIPQNAFLVGFCGYPHFIKGVDLLPAIASQVINNEKQRPIHFLWLGENNLEIVKNVENKCKEAGFIERIHFVGFKNNNNDYFISFNVFALPSRTESFSLACLENAKFGNPIICFDGASGAQEYIDNESGRIVPFEDTSAMAEAILDYYNNPHLLQQAIINIQNNVKYINFYDSVKQIKKVIEEQF